MPGIPSHTLPPLMVYTASIFPKEPSSSSSSFLLFSFAFDYGVFLNVCGMCPSVFSEHTLRQWQRAHWIIDRGLDWKGDTDRPRVSPVHRRLPQWRSTSDWVDGDGTCFCFSPRFFRAGKKMPWITWNGLLMPIPTSPLAPPTPPTPRSTT